jgi:hypothetical protein
MLRAHVDAAGRGNGSFMRVRGRRELVGLVLSRREFAYYVGGPRRTSGAVPAPKNG